MFGSVAGVAEGLLALVAVFTGEGFLPCVTSLVDLEVLQSGKTPAAVGLAALERPLARVDPEVGHQLVLGVERLGVTGTVLGLTVRTVTQGGECGGTDPPVAGVLLGAALVLDVLTVDVSHQLGLVREILRTVGPLALAPTDGLVFSNLHILLVHNIGRLRVGPVHAVIALLGRREEFLG